MNSMSNVMCQKYQGVLVHLVPFCSMKTTHASLTVLTHKLLHRAGDTFTGSRRAPTDDSTFK